jgi:hypothetical protein
MQFFSDPLRVLRWTGPWIEIPFKIVISKRR